MFAEDILERREELLGNCCEEPVGTLEMNTDAVTLSLYGTIWLLHLCTVSHFPVLSPYLAVP